MVMLNIYRYAKKLVRFIGLVLTIGILKMKSNGLVKYVYFKLIFMINNRATLS